MFVCPECGHSAAAPGFCTEHGLPLAESTDPLLGATVGSYRVARLIGRGGMGQVYLGVQPNIGSRVAIKVLSPESGQASSLVDRFFAEARAVNVIRHESIVNVLDLASLPDGRPYIVMEYLQGAPLSALIAGHGPLPLGFAVVLMQEVLAALGAAHSHGVIHRDLKPDNVYVTSGGRAKVLDFGIAKLKPEVSAISGETRTGALLGTPQYMSPEQAMGRPVDLRSDLYSVGVILYEMLTGRRPFDGSTLWELLKQHIEIPPAPPSSSRADLPPALQSVVLRALEKDPARRFQSAQEMSNALGQCAQFLPQQSFTPVGMEGISVSAFRSAPGTGPGPTMPGYATTSSQPAPKSSRGLLVAGLVVGGVLLIGAVGAVAVFSTVAARPGKSTPAKASASASASAAAPAASSAPSPLAEKNLAGKYSIEVGSLPGGTGAYRGVVTITNKATNIYGVDWTIVKNPPYSGIAIQRGNVLGVGWGQGAAYGIAVYTIDGGHLTGTWALSSTGDLLGREELEGPASLDGLFKITDSWSPQSQSPYSGTATIKPRGELFDVTWRNGNQEQKGVGLRKANTLVVGFGPPGAGVVLYDAKSDGSLVGRWTMVGAAPKTAGLETLAPKAP